MLRSNTRAERPLCLSSDDAITYTSTLLPSNLRHVVEDYILHSGPYVPPPISWSVMARWTMERYRLETAGIHVQTSAKEIFIPGDLEYCIDKDLGCFIESATQLQKLSLSYYGLNGIYRKDLIGSSELSCLCQTSLHGIVFECDDVAVWLEHHAHRLERIDFRGIVLKDSNWEHMFDRMRGMLFNSLNSLTLSYLLCCSGDGLIVVEEIYQPDLQGYFYQYIGHKANKLFRSASCSNFDYPYRQGYLRMAKDALERLRLE